MTDATDGPQRTGDPFAAASEFVERHFGTIVESAPVLTWGGSFVARFSVPTTAFYLKSHSSHSVLPEAWALDAARAAGAMVPLVVGRGADAPWAGRRDWIAVEAVAGEPWALPADLATIPEETYGVLADQLRLVHSVGGVKWGHFDSAGRGEANSWSAWLDDVIDLRVSELPGVTSDVSKRLRNAVEIGRSALDSRPGVLVHGDLGNREILMSATGTVNGFVDFGNALFGDPVFDFAHFMAGGLPDDRRPPGMAGRLMAAYYRRVRPPARLLWLWTMYGIVNDLDNMAWARDEGLTDWMEPLWQNVERSVLALEIDSFPLGR